MELPRPSLGLPVLACLLPLACGGATGPDVGRCNERDGIEICTPRSAYRPGAAIPFSILNRGSATVFQDMCSGQVVGRTSPDHEFVVTSGARRSCGDDPPLEVILANMRELPPGGALDDAFTITTFAFQGEWRLELWFLDAEGRRISEEPFTSALFDVFPSADGD